jgi:hypothetical protein
MDPEPALPKEIPPVSWYSKISLGAIALGGLLIGAQLLFEPKHLLFLAAGLLLVVLGGGMLWLRIQLDF